MDYKIYQVKCNLTREFAYMGLSFMKDLEIEVDLDNYDLAYIGHIDGIDSVIGVLEELYQQFNINHPDDFYGRSMSVSDIVEVDESFYFCDSFGWSVLNNIY